MVCPFTTDAQHGQGAWVLCLASCTPFLFNTGNMKTTAVLVAISLAASANAARVARYDFTKDRHGWQGNHHTAEMRVTAEGLTFRSTGIDPWLTSPVVELPADARIKFTVRMLSGAGGTARLFWGNGGFSEERAENLAVPADGKFHETSLVIRGVAGQTRFRFDPATQEGPITIQWISVESLPNIKPPPMRKPSRPVAGDKAPWQLTHGDVTLTHYRRAWGSFVLSVAGKEIASGHAGGRLACEVDETPLFLALADADFTVRREDDAIVERAVLADARTGTWVMTRRFAPGPASGLEVSMSLEIHEGGRLLHYPWLTLFPGLGTFGERKTQALIPGVEYLADEPSSSKADIRSAAHLRRVPRPHKLCFPMVAFCHEGHCLSLRWPASTHVALVHDSPDRILDSGAHLMGLWAPNVGPHRLENDLFALEAVPIDPGKPLCARAVIHGCRGNSVVPAVREYVAVSGLPDVPRLPGEFDAAVELMAAGWTRSSGYDKAGRWKHAVWGKYEPQPAADACAFALWLSFHSSSEKTRSRLEEAVEAGVAHARKADVHFAGGVSHVRPATAPFLFGDVAAFLRGQKRNAAAELKRFAPDGSRPYRQREGKPNYASTHFAKHANGCSAAQVTGILRAALLTGDRELATGAVALLDKQTALYANTVPRGAQTWEVPLHTPDILASAHMVSAYVLGHKLTGRQDLLEQAVYWAWTGVPFVYLDRWTPGAVGDYATIPVLGATSWRSPLWIGLPVQWCGRVYADALETLAPLDPEGPWDRITKGITASGLQQSWSPPDERQGLLPDFFAIETQHRDGPAINPGTVQSGLPYLYGKNRLFDSSICRKTGWIVHAPCTIRNLQEEKDGLRFELDGWGARPYTAALVRVAAKPGRISVTPTAGAAPAVEHHADEGWLILGNLRGAVTIDIRR